jgi:hypothetical protein
VKCASKAYGIIDYLEKGQTINSKYYIALLERLNDEINKKKWPYLKKKSAISSRQCTVSQINENDGNIPWIGLQIGSPFTAFSRSGPSDFFLSEDLKKMIDGKKFCTNESSKLRPIFEIEL